MVTIIFRYLYVQRIRIIQYSLRINCTYMRENFYKQLGKNIKKRRKELNLTQQELATRLGLSLNFIGKIEVAFSKPSLDTLIDIAEKLETTVSELSNFSN